MRFSVRDAWNSIAFFLLPSFIATASASDFFYSVVVCVLFRVVHIFKSIYHLESHQKALGEKREQIN